MKRIINTLTIAISVFLQCCSCSTMVIQEQVPKELYQSESSISTKAGDIVVVDTALKQCHEVQSNHIILLLNHLVIKDGVYMLSLSSKDMDSLSIDESELALIEEYKQTLNKQSDEE